MGTKEFRMEIKDCLPEVLSEAVQFMYGEDITNNCTEYEGLLEIAERFLMDDFKHEASLHIARKIQLNEENYLAISQMAEKYHAKALGVKCAKFILYNAKGINVDWEMMEKMPMVMAFCSKESKEMVGMLRVDSQSCLTRGPCCQFCVSYRNN